MFDHSTFYDKMSLWTEIGLATSWTFISIIPMFLQNFHSVFHCSCLNVGKASTCFCVITLWFVKALLCIYNFPLFVLQRVSGYDVWSSAANGPNVNRYSLSLRNSGHLCPCFEVRFIFNQHIINGSRNEKQIYSTNAIYS